jgi:putative (di)nucleoside polyphosphate hydrolase
MAQSEAPLKARKPEDYRPCVGMMVLNRTGHVWVGHRFDTEPHDKLPNAEGQGNWWQMPQGGIDADEDPRAAAFRELLEETAIQSVTVIAEAPDWLYYDLPGHLIGHSWRGRYRGQRQRWFAMRFTGDDSEINVINPPGHTAEFDAWKWVPMNQLTGLIVPFKRGVYTEVVAAFEHLAGA